MSEQNNGGPAFREAPIETNGFGGALGMTMRDYFAAKAMASIICVREGALSTSNAAKLAYKMADAMLAER